MSGIRVVVVDAAPRSRAQLVRALEADGDVVVVGQCDRGDAALDAVRSVRPDVVVLTGMARQPATSTVETTLCSPPARYASALPTRTPRPATQSRSRATPPAVPSGRGPGSTDRYARSPTAATTCSAR